jgi:GAF domain
MSHDAPGPTLQARTEAFLSEFFAKGEELVRELIEENDRLRLTIATGRGDSAVTSTTIERLSRQIAALEAECGELRRLATGVRRDDGGGFRERLDDLEREHYRLAAMYVAGSQFHRAATVEDVLRTLTEILLNFVGVGRFTVFVVDEERQALFPLLREGAPIVEVEEAPLGTGPTGDLTALAGPWRPGAPLGEGPGVLMHLPLCSGTRLVGVARIEKFLPQKQRFDDGDFGLLELVSEQAGVGIETAWIRAHAREVPLQRAALERLVGS